jgi:hypothetical protein
MNAHRFSASLFAALLVSASLFAQMPQPGSPNNWARLQKEEHRALRQQPSLNRSIANAQAHGQDTKKEPAQPHYGQNTANRRVMRQKRDARNVK